MTMTNISSTESQSDFERENWATNIPMF